MRIDIEGKDVTVRFSEGETAFSPKVAIDQTATIQVVLDPDKVRM